MQFVDQPHVGEDVCVAHVVERLVLREMQHEPARIAEIGVGAAMAAEGRGVQRLDEGEAVSSPPWPGVARTTPTHAWNADPIEGAARIAG